MVVELMTQAVQRYDKEALHASLALPNVDKDTLREVFKRVGLEGIVKKKTPYDFFISEMLSKNTQLNKYFGYYTIFEGSGWSIGAYFIYSPTFEGIRRIAEVLRLGIQVLEEQAVFNEHLSALKEGERKAVIIDSGLLSKVPEKSYHAISCFLEHTGDHINLFINDSLGEIKGEQCYLTTTQKIVKYCSSQKRQKGEAPYCNSFALSDCAAFNRFPGLLSEIAIKAKMGRANDSFIIEELPPQMQTLVGKEAGLKGYLEYCSHLIEPLTN